MFIFLSKMTSANHNFIIGTYKRCLRHDDAKITSVIVAVGTAMFSNIEFH